MKTRRENILKTKSFDFALMIISAYKEIVAKQKEYVLTRQVLKSGTSIGAMVRESEFAQSKPDFISKLSIALKEANETEYWLLLLKKSDYLSKNSAEELLIQNNELISILIASIKTTKDSLKTK